MIYTTREINVNGNTATIDEDIYLFKQDSNIELKFIINNTRFTFQTTESTNVVESSNASYFRVKLLNPYGKTINFPIQEVTDNFIVLLITEELIDEDTEVGDYTIQIRLYDKDKNSKLTLPAITNCIHIQQPIFNEVEEGTVDTAAIDTASVMESDEGELPVVDSTGKYIPTVWNTGDTISKAKINHIEKGILQTHTDALGAKIPKITPPKGTATSDIVTLYNELPDNGLVYIIDEYMIGDVLIGNLCSICSYSLKDSSLEDREASNNNIKHIACYETGMYIDITSTGTIDDYGMCNENLNNLMYVLTDPQRKTGQVFTMTSDNEYGWGDVIPHITPPEGTSTSDIINLYNMLPENGTVFFTKGYRFSPKSETMIGLCSVGSSSENTEPTKTIICSANGVFVVISSTGEVVLSSLCNSNLNGLMNSLNDKNRKNGQVFTMISEDKYGWADAIPKITPPKGTTTSDIVTFYNSLGESDFVTLVDGFVIDDITFLGLCEINSFKTSDNIPCKGLYCLITGMCMNITSTGNILSKGITDPNIGEMVQALHSQDRKKGQVLTMTSDNEYGWAGTTPQPYVHSVTGSKEVELTVDPYQIIELGDLSSPAVTVTILLPMIEESDIHAYKIHVLLMGSSSIEYELPSGFYDKQLGTLQNGVVYELIYTYIGGDWVCHCIEYSNKISNAPV